MNFCKALINLLLVNTYFLQAQSLTCAFCDQTSTYPNCAKKTWETHQCKDDEKWCAIYSYDEFVFETQNDINVTERVCINGEDVDPYHRERGGKKWCGSVKQYGAAVNPNIKVYGCLCNYEDNCNAPPS